MTLGEADALSVRLKIIVVEGVCLLERTRGVLLLSITFCALGACLFIISLWGLRDLAEWGLLQPLDVVLLMAMLVGGLVCSAAAVGLFQLRYWGRRLVMALSLLGVALGLAGFFVPVEQLASRSTLLAFLSDKFPRFNLVVGAIVVLVGLTALWYLSKPRVKILFLW